MSYDVVTMLAASGPYIPFRPTLLFNGILALGFVAVAMQKQA
jgi:hypothetical protein